MAQSNAVDQAPFAWDGTDRNGKRIKGKTLAANEAAVRADLRRQASCRFESVKTPNSSRAGAKSHPRTSPFSAAS